MKRSQMARKILKKLQEWEGSRLEMKTAREILDVIEEAGMMPPDRLAHLDPPCAMEFEWEPERKKK